MNSQLKLCLALLLVWGCGSNNTSLPNKYGSISLESASEGIAAGSPKAFFYEYTSSGTGVCDVYVDDGTCRVWQCNDDAYTSLPAISVLDAGSLEVAGANRALAFSRADDGSYEVLDFDGAALWNGGETLTGTVAGSADIPAATLSILAPPALNVTAPEITTEGLTIEVAKDLPISWQQLETADSIYVAISTETDASQPDGTTIPNLAPALDCKFAGNAGTGVVRSSLLSLMPKPAGLKAYHLDVLTFAYSQQRFNDSVLELRATWLGLSTTPTVQ